MEEDQDNLDCSCIMCKPFLVFSLNQAEQKATIYLQTPWIFQRGKVSFFCCFWEEFPNFASLVCVVNSDCFFANLSNLYNLENSSQAATPGNLSQGENFPRNLFLAENSLPRILFKARYFYKL